MVILLAIWSVHFNSNFNFIRVWLLHLSSTTLTNISPSFLFIVFIFYWKSSIISFGFIFQIILSFILHQIYHFRLFTSLLTNFSFSQFWYPLLWLKNFSLFIPNNCYFQAIIRLFLNRYRCQIFEETWSTGIMICLLPSFIVMLFLFWKMQ